MRPPHSTQHTCLPSSSRTSQADNQKYLTATETLRAITGEMAKGGLIHDSQQSILRSYGPPPSQRSPLPCPIFPASTPHLDLIQAEPPPTWLSQLASTGQGGPEPAERDLLPTLDPGAVNTHILPMQSTLRGSFDFPPSDQSVEVELQAKCSETPKAERRAR